MIPRLLALAEVASVFPGRPVGVVVSLGCGQTKRESAGRSGGRSGAGSGGVSQKSRARSCLARSAGSDELV